MDDRLISAALAHAASTIEHAVSLQETLQTVAESASISVPGIQHVGVWAFDCRGRPRTRAATSDLVWTLESLQRSLKQGPYLRGLGHRPLVAVPSFRGGGICGGRSTPKPPAISGWERSSRSRSAAGEVRSEA
jgi:hypothetical protein